MVACFLSAELSGESPGIEERGEPHDDHALAFGILASAHLSVCSRKKRVGEQLNATSRAPGKGSITSLDSLAVMMKEIMCHAHVLGRNDMGAVKAERAFEPGQRLRCSPRPHQNGAPHLVAVRVARIDFERAVD